MDGFHDYDGQMVSGDKCALNFWHLSYSWEKTPKKTSTRKLTRTGFKPSRPAGWEATMLPLDHSSGLEEVLIWHGKPSFIWLLLDCRRGTKEKTRKLPVYAGEEDFLHYPIPQNTDTWKTQSYIICKPRLYTHTTGITASGSPFYTMQERNTYMASWDLWLVMS